MVYGTMERHEGRIEVDSAIRKGTTIRLVFPLRQPAEGRKRAVPVAAREMQSLRALCIDDEPLLREILKETLQLNHHTVETADGGGTGLEMFYQARAEARPFDVVITDLGMPGVNGRQVAEAVKKSSPDTVVIMLTGWGNMLEANSQDTANVDALLSKPPKMNELLDTLLRLKGRSASPAPAESCCAQPMVVVGAV
jgi:CheY-like chemotaxis protein